MSTSSSLNTRWVPNPRWLMIAVTTVVVAIPVTFSSLGTPGLRPVVSPLVPVTLGAALLALQLRHSFSAARGERPAGAAWTLGLMVLLAYIPLFKLGGNWPAAQALVSASALMTLRGRLALAVAAAPIIGTSIYVPIDDAVRFPTEIDARVVSFDILYWLLSMTSSTAVLYGVAWLVRTVDALHSARTELAEVAVGRERLRLSRDLHDLLGQSLSAVSLKGDLALRLLATNPVAARGEIASLTEVAREALHGVRTVTRDVHDIDLQTELDGAARLLAAAGVDARIDAGHVGLHPRLEQIFAWAVREAVTNVLRHARANCCTVTIVEDSGRMVLTVVNDGLVDPVTAGGTGLDGIAERARSGGGRMSAGRADDGVFRVVVELPLKLVVT